jgi:hypothetical protein
MTLIVFNPLLFDPLPNLPDGAVSQATVDTPAYKKGSEPNLLNANMLRAFVWQFPATLPPLPLPMSGGHVDRPGVYHHHHRTRRLTSPHSGVPMLNLVGRVSAQPKLAWYLSYAGMEDSSSAVMSVNSRSTPCPPDIARKGGQRQERHEAWWRLADSA